jgi:hypothetical protein
VNYQTRYIYIYIQQGIQQGAKLSTSLYKCYNNVILDSISKSGLGSHFGNIGIADTELQGILDIVHNHTQRDLVEINPDKSDLIVYNTKDVKFGDKKIEKSEKTKHLGIVRNGKNTVDIKERLKSGRGTIYGLLGAGLQVRKGFSSITAHNLWKVYALPRMTYGLEIMPMTNKDKEQLEILQKKILKQNQGLPCRAANTGVYVLLGAVPVEMVIERNMLSTFMNIARNTLSVEYYILSRELAMKNENGKIFINRIQEILGKYGLGKVEEYLHSPKAKGPTI